MSITTRNRALPLIMRSQASAARSSGTVSTIGRMPLSALKASVSSGSATTPEGEPWPLGDKLEWRHLDRL